MEVRKLLEQLRAERDSLDTLIAGLEGRLRGSQSQAKTAGQPKAHGRRWTEADRLKMSKRIKEVLAAKRAKAARAKGSKSAAPKASD